jgi:hypothetical protein
VTGASAARDVTRASSGIAGGAANKDPALREELEALSGLSFIVMGASSRAVPELFGIYGMLAPVQLTTACIESDLSRPRGTKSDNRSTISCLSLEGVLQANDLLADLVDVPFTLPASKARH